MIKGNNHSSYSIACLRLKHMLKNENPFCSTFAMEQLKGELRGVTKKYIQIDSDEYEIVIRMKAHKEKSITC